MADKKGMNPLVAGAVGAVVGVAGAAAVQALSKEENQKKVQETFGKVKDYASKKMSDMKKTKENFEDKAEDSAKSARSSMEQTRKKYSV